MKKSQKLKIAIEALEAIAFTDDYLKGRYKLNDGLDKAKVLELSVNPNYLKSIALDAISKIEEE